MPEPRRGSHPWLPHGCERARPRPQQADRVGLPTVFSEYRLQRKRSGSCSRAAELVAMVSIKPASFLGPGRLSLNNRRSSGRFFQYASGPTVAERLYVLLPTRSAEAATDLDGENGGVPSCDDWKSKKGTPISRMQDIYTRAVLLIRRIKSIILPPAKKVGLSRQ